MDQVIFHIKFDLNLILMPIFDLYFTWRSIYAVLSALGRSWMDLNVSFLFVGNNRQHMSLCTTMISSWVRKVLSISKAHISLGTL